jgi:hypothetical protein
VRNCPTHVSDNCKWRSYKCYCCLWAGKSQKDYYDPIDSSLPKPTPVKGNKKSLEVKMALRSERKAIENIAKATLASGRIAHDGDALHLGDLRVEHKLRLKSRSVTVTSKELDKAKQQRINVFEIELQERNETYYVLDRQTYYKIIQILHDVNSPGN